MCRGDLYARQMGLCPVLLPLIDLQLSNSRYENLVVALAENTGPNSPDHQQLTSMFLFLPQLRQDAASPVVPF